MCFQVYKGIKQVDYKVDLLGFSFPLWGQAVLLRPTQTESSLDKRTLIMCNHALHLKYDEMQFLFWKHRIGEVEWQAFSILK